MGLVVHLHLLKGCDGTEADMMLLVIMTESNGEALPLLQTSIDSLMASTSTVHEVLMRVIFGNILSDNLRFSTVSLVRNNLLTIREHLLHLVAKDFQVIPATSIEWSSIRDDVASKDTDTKLISQGGTLEFLGEPDWIEWTGLNNKEVDTINGDKASLSCIANEMVLPPNL